MPSIARKIDTAEPEIDTVALFMRLRSSGMAAVQIAGWLPAFLDQGAADDDMERIAVSISTCCEECKSMSSDAEASGDPRLAEVAKKVLGLWVMLADKTDAVSFPAQDARPHA